MPRRSRPRFDDLPLFATDLELGAALLGQGRAREFTGIATMLEREGFPPVLALWGGRYVPAVRAFLDQMHGGAAPVARPVQAMENPDAFARRPVEPVRRKVGCG
jgi:hypothetical protein